MRTVACRHDRIRPAVIKSGEILATFATELALTGLRGKALFTRGNRKSFVFNVPAVSNQRVPTTAAPILRKVESLLLRH